MKRILLITAFFALSSTALAQTLKVEALTPFNTVNPPSVIELKSLGEIQITKKIKIKEGDILSGYLSDISDPKRLKRDATFKYQINSVTSADGVTKNVTENNIAKYVSPFKLNKKEVAKTAALTVGNHFVEGISVGYRAVEGAVKDETGNRATSAVKNVYDNSLLSLISKGDDVEINVGDIFGLKINSEEEIEEYEAEHAPNYTYTVPQ